MTFVLISFLLLGEALLINGVKSFLTSHKSLTEQLDSNLSSNSSAISPQDDFETDLEQILTSANISNYITSLLLGDHHLAIRLAYKAKLSGHTAENIVKAFKKTCVKVLQDHRLEVPDYKTKKRYDYYISQPPEFVAKKRKFLSNLELFFNSCPQENKALIDSILQKDLQKLYSWPVLSLPVDRLQLLYIGMSPEKIKNTYEKAILVAIAKSRDKKSKTPTTIYNYNQKNDEEVLLLQRLLPSVNWSLDNNCVIVDMPENSPYH